MVDDLWQRGKNHRSSYASSGESHLRDIDPVAAMTLKERTTVTIRSQPGKPKFADRDVNLAMPEWQLLTSVPVFQL